MTRNRTCSLALVLAPVLLPVSASALLIDDFESGDFSITDTTPAANPPPSDFQGGLSGVHAGSRESFANLSNGSSLTASVSGGALTISAPTGSGGYFRTWWDGTANDLYDPVGAYSIDLTEGGTIDRFALDVLAVTGTVELYIGVSSPGSGGGTTIEHFTVSTPGVVELLFADYSASADFTDVDTIVIQANGPAGIGSGDSVTLESLSTIPEPGTALLLGLGLAGLARRTRRETDGGLVRRGR